MSSRKLVLLVGILGVLGVGAYAAYRSPWLRGWLAKDEENVGEIAKLSDRKLEVAAIASPATGWFQWRGPNRDGRAPAGPLRTDWDKTPPKLLWRADCAGGYSSPIVADGKVYIQDYRDGNERVLCLAADTGNALWDFDYPADYSGTDKSYAIGPRATPTVEGNRLYVVGGAGKFLCLEASTEAAGRPSVAWQHDLLKAYDAKLPQWGVACSPLIEGDLVIVQPGGSKGSVVAFDKRTGAQRWTGGSNQSSYSSPVAATIGGQRVIFALTGDAFLAIRAADGKVTDSYAWKPSPDINVATPLVVDDYVFISSAYGQGCALLRAEARAGEVKFTPVYARLGRGFQNHHSTSVYKDRYLFGFDGTGDSARLKCVNFATGKAKEGWETEGIERASGTLILAGNHLIIQTQRGDLVLVEATPEECRLVAKIPKVLTGKNNWATPTLIDGRLYLRDEEKVVCYDVR